MKIYNENNKRMTDFVFKVIVVGQSGVGKTAIVQRYVQKQFQEFEHATIGVDIGMKMLDIEGYSIQLKIWDSAGSERFKSLTTSYYRNADAAILVYCINDTKTLHELHMWASEVSNRQSDMLKILVGNKNDLLDERTISHQTAVEFAMMEHLDLAVECSAKCDDNIDYIFYTIGRKLLIKEIQRHSNNTPLTNTRTKVRDNVVDYESTRKSMENLFVSPRSRSKTSKIQDTRLSHSNIELTRNRNKNIFRKICAIL